jgi:hypothetical protein
LWQCADKSIQPPVILCRLRVVVVPVFDAKKFFWPACCVVQSFSLFKWDRAVGDVVGDADEKRRLKKPPLDELLDEEGSPADETPRLKVIAATTTRPPTKNCRIFELLFARASNSGL